MSKHVEDFDANLEKEKVQLRTPENAGITKGSANASAKRSPCSLWQKTLPACLKGDSRHSAGGAVASESGRRSEAGGHRYLRSNIAASPAKSSARNQVESDFLQLPRYINRAQSLANGQPGSPTSRISVSSSQRPETQSPAGPLSTFKRRRASVVCREVLALLPPEVRSPTPERPGGRSAKKVRAEFRPMQKIADNAGTPTAAAAAKRSRQRYHAEEQGSGSVKRQRVSVEGTCKTPGVGELQAKEEEPEGSRTAASAVLDVVQARPKKANAQKKVPDATEPPRQPNGVDQSAQLVPQRPPGEGGYIFTTTGIELSSRQKRILSDLGILFHQEWSGHATHLVADTFRRTTKMMCSICLGAHVVTLEFIRACRNAGKVVDERPFVLEDGVCEAAFARKRGIAGGYSLAQALERSRNNGPLLRGMSVYCFPSVSEKRELPLLVAAAGGTWLTRFPAERADDESVLLLAERTVSNEREQLRRAKHRVYDVELLREAACTQAIRRTAYRLR